MTYSEFEKKYPEFLAGQRSPTRRSWKHRGEVPWARVRDAELFNSMKSLSEPPCDQGYPRVVWTSDTGSWRIVELFERNDCPIRPGHTVTWEQLNPCRFVLESVDSDAMGDVSWARHSMPNGFLSAVARSLGVSK